MTNALRYFCQICGGYMETQIDRLVGWEARKQVFNTFHKHGDIVTLRVTLTPVEQDSFSQVLSNHGLIAHNIAAVTDGSKAFFVSKNHCPFAQAVRIFASSPQQLEDRLPPALL